MMLETSHASQPPQERDGAEPYPLNDAGRTPTDTNEVIKR